MLEVGVFVPENISIDLIANKFGVLLHLIAYIPLAIMDILAIILTEFKYSYLLIFVCDVF